MGVTFVFATYTDLVVRASRTLYFTELLTTLAINSLNKVLLLIVIFKSHMIIKNEGDK